MHKKVLLRFRFRQIIPPPPPEMMELLLQPEPEIEKKKHGNVCAQRVKRQWKRKARYPGLDQNPPFPPKIPPPLVIQPQIF